MNDKQKAASILRQYAGELFQGHTIGGEWPEESASIKAEYEEMQALADALSACQPQERGEAVAQPEYWVTSNGKQFWPNSEVKNPDNWLLAGLRPLYAHPPADDARVAELEAQLAELRDYHAGHVSSAQTSYDEFTARIAALEAQLASLDASYRGAEMMLDATKKQLTTLREREGRMREALLPHIADLRRTAHEIRKSPLAIEFESTAKEFDRAADELKAALAADKGEK